MRNTGLSLAIAVAVIYASFAGFIFTKTVDESTLPGAARVEVAGQVATTGGGGLPKLVQDAAENSNAVIIREVSDLQSSAVRHLYVAVGDPGRAEARWLSNGYPSFSTTIRTVVHPVDDLQGIDPRGRYYILGPTDATSTIAAVFGELGYGTQIEQKSVSAGQAIAWFTVGPLGSATLVAMLLIALLAGTSAISRVKSYAIQQLHGVNKRTAIMRDFQQVALPGALSLVAMAVLGLVCLWFYNDLHQIRRLLQVSATVFLISLALALCIHAAAVKLIWDTRLVDGIKGRLGFRVAVPVAYLIRIPGLVIAISVVASTFAAAGAALEAGQARQELEVAGTAARITFEAKVPPAKMDELAYESGAWLQKEDEAGHTILAVPLQLDGSTATAKPDVLMVNGTYLEKNVVLDDNGDRISDTTPGKPTVLMPAGSSTSAEDILALVGGTETNTESPASAEVRQIQAGQSHFLYEPRPDGQQRPTWANNTVLVVVDPKSGLIRDDDYMAYASQGRVLMTNAEQAVQNTPSNLLGPWISAYVPVVQAAADEYTTQMTALRIKAASAVVALGVLLATAVGLAQIHVRGNAQSILVRFLHGWRFVTTHRWLFMAEAALLAVVSCWAAIRAASTFAMQRSETGAGLVRSADLAIAMWQPWAVLIVAVLNIGLLVGMVQIRTHLMIRTHSEETA